MRPTPCAAKHTTLSVLRVSITDALVYTAAQPPTLLGTTEKKFALERQAAQSISVFIHHRSERKIIYRTVNNVKHSVTRHTSLAMLKMPPGSAGNLDKESLPPVKIISRNLLFC
jgi:hypothetical protein